MIMFVIFLHEGIHFLSLFFHMRDIDLSSHSCQSKFLGDEGLSLLTLGEIIYDAMTSAGLTL